MNLGQFEQILGIRFLDSDVDTAIASIQNGGLMIVPAAPALTLLPTDSHYREAAAGCDFAIVDSIYLTLLWFTAKRKVLHRVSGLRFLRAFFESAVSRRPGALFLVNPSNEEGQINREWLQGQGIIVANDHCYTAPLYPSRPVNDPGLLAVIERHRPQFILLNIGGGVQEPLGWYLKQHLSYTPAILCTGAAIAFLTGRQAAIPDWIDRLGLGWLSRIAFGGRKFVRRYASALKLATLVYKHGSQMPPLDTHA
jgi:N-acetylglucosaminyldiphosphoundecaprenol N-acetyl-beta-D-mannosaminyltransferase